jgi:putative methyltransferase (TIGR04325 family)
MASRDLPAMVREGKRRLTPETRALEFFERAEETAACDVLLCFGVLQYAEATIDEIVARLPAKPRWISPNDRGRPGRPTRNDAARKLFADILIAL